MTSSRNDSGNPLLGMVEDLEADARIDPLADRMSGPAAAIGGSAAGPALRGEPIGHALHPLLTDLPIGFWTSSFVLDLIGGRRARSTSQRLVGLGVLSAVPTIAAGLADFDQIDGTEERRVAAVHAVGNAGVTVAYVASWRARRKGHHLRGVGWGFVGGALASATGYLGGHLSYARSVGTGERPAPERQALPSGEHAGSTVDLREAASILEAGEEQVRAMVAEGLLTPVDDGDAPRFDEAEVRSVRLIGG